MKFVFGIVLMIGGLCGALMSFLSDIVVNSSMPLFDGLELSIGLGLFSIVMFIGGLYNLLSTT